MGCCITTTHKSSQLAKLNQSEKDSSEVVVKTSVNTSMPKSQESKDVPSFQSSTNKIKKRELTDVYNIKKCIGQGSFGIVRKGQHKNDPNLIVAIKSIDKFKIKSNLHLLKREVSILQSIDHPNIIKFYETFDDGKYLHIVMEFCSGGELFEKIMEKGKINEKKAACYMEKILLAVNHLHQVGVCHRDLKPENFLFENDSPNAELKIIDFGLSNKFGDKFKHTTKMETFVGTPYYVAPEVIKGEYGPKCDLWSVGVIMYVMLTGHHPFKGETPTQIFQNVVRGELNMESPVWETISEPAKDLLRKLIVTDPNQRLCADDALRHHWFSDAPKAKIELDPNIICALRHYKPKSQMQRAALGIIVKYLSLDQIKDLRQAFYDIDLDQKGELNIDEIEQALNKCGIELPKTQLFEIFKNLDYNGTGSVKYSEFLAATISSRIQLDEHTLWMAFKVFDKDDQGFITPANVYDVLTNMGKNVSRIQVKNIIKEVDLDHTEKITFEDFKKLLSDGKINC
ncbi:unnamed protein product [Blepharisma stoltei]|uniref:Mitogen-activated protein kinase n=1 Tax=Blepharisma stoltei TaxID=1481888 RepID=A0AAU9IFI4_9CILI|nr:unnamed protein product [Blepharisma stoltei]